MWASAEWVKLEFYVSSVTSHSVLANQQDTTTFVWIERGSTKMATTGLASTQTTSTNPSATTPTPARTPFASLCTWTSTFSSRTWPSWGPYLAPAPSPPKTRCCGTNRPGSPTPKDYPARTVCLTSASFHCLHSLEGEISSNQFFLTRWLRCPRYLGLGSMENMC